MLLRLNTGVLWECDTINVNIAPGMRANDAHTLAAKEGIIRSAKQMGSYVALSRLGIQVGLLDPNIIVSVEV